MIDPMVLPDGLPEPVDDGACDHLVGTTLSDIALPATDRRKITLAALPGRSIIYAYPRSGRPGEPSLVEDWDTIPGARGCTPEACGFRDHHADLAVLGARVFGLSTQPSAYQREFAKRLDLPFPILSDASLELTAALSLPTFEVAGETLLCRHTIVLIDGVIEHVFYPVFPPDRHAAKVVAWLRNAG